MIVTHKINADLTRKRLLPVVEVMQDDKYSRNFEIALTANGVVWEIPSDAVAIVRFKKSDGTGGNYDTLPNGETAYSIVGNVITVALAPQVCTAPGHVELAVGLISGDAEVNTFTVELNVCRNPGLDIISENYYKVSGLVSFSGWEANLYLGTDENGNVAAKELPVTKGTGEKSIVIATGDAQGDYSVAGGTNDKSLAEKYVGWGLLDILPEVDPAMAEGNLSLALGAGVKALTDGSVVLGVSNIAGCKGFYWFDINYGTNTITLSRTQARKSALANPNPVWDAAAAAQLAKWEVGDLVSIENDTKHTLCSKITAINSANGTITVDSLPFAEEIKVALPLFDEYSVSCPSKPEAGVVDIGLSAYAIGVANKASGTFSHVEGYNNFGAGAFSHVEGKDNTAGAVAHAEGAYTKALGNRSHAEGGSTTALGLASHAEGSGTLASGGRAHAEGLETRATGDNAHTEGYNTEASGNQAHAEGHSTSALNYHSHSEGFSTTASGNSSHAEGRETDASGEASHTEGYLAKATERFSHAEGRETMASGDTSHAEGYQTVASGMYSHAEGDIARSAGRASHAEGGYTRASGAQSHAEGANTVAKADNSHAEGYLSEANGIGAHAEGRQTIASAAYTHTEGWGTTAESIGAHSEGCNTLACNEYSHAEGVSTSASGIGSHAEGEDARALGRASHAEGHSSYAEGVYSHAEGEDTHALGKFSHAEGGTATSTGLKRGNTYGTKEVGVNIVVTSTVAEGDRSHAEGEGAHAYGRGSHAEGLYTYAGSYNAHAEGQLTQALGAASHAEGWDTVAKGANSHAEGHCTASVGSYSHAEGFFTTATRSFQHVQGKYNIPDANGNYAHVVGNGDDGSERNAHTLDWGGNAVFAGAVSGSGADYAEYFEWADGNTNDEDRVGLIVTLEGDKIRPANNGDDVLGVVSGTAMVIGDNAEWEWKNKYLCDDYGRVITEMVEEFVETVNSETGETEKKSLGFFPHRKLNPEYDPEQKYLRRDERPEWDTVGLVGKLHVTDDGSCVVGGYATVGENGIATASTEKTNMRVMKRITENIVLVFMK